MTREASPEALRTALAAFLNPDEKTNPQPEFDVHIASYRDYDDLLAIHNAAVGEPEDLAAMAQQSGRVLLCGRGGSAKTVLSRRIARALNTDERGTVAPFVQLKGWTNDRFAQWDELEALDRLDLLLSLLGSADVTLSQIDLLPADVPKVLIIDGLNEVSLPIGKQIIDAADEFARIFPAASTIVTDRLVRRDLANPKRWRYAAVAPLSAEEVQRQWERVRGAVPPDVPAKVRELWSSPYFLDAALRGELSPDGSSASLILGNLTTHSGLGAETIPVASEAAFEAYRRYQSRMVPRQFAASHFAETLDALMAAGVLVADGDDVLFSHQLQHDALAANHLAWHKELWTPKDFDDVTLNASSFDSLAMTVELAPSIDQADEFVRAVYDWNLYGAAYAATESHPRPGAGISTDMAAVLLAMLAIRRWDPLEATRTKSEDALRLFHEEDSSAYLRAESIEEIRSIVAMKNSGATWFAEWKQIFLSAPARYSADAAIEDIATSGSLRGWTAANVLRQNAISSAAANRLRSVLEKEPKDLVRWRLVHALGGDPTGKTADALLDRLVRDEYLWVRYGSARALVEIAANGSQELRQHVFGGIAELAEEIATSPHVVNEFLRALFISTAPEDWYEATAPAVVALYDAIDDFDVREGIRGAVSRLKSVYKRES